MAMARISIPVRLVGMGMHNNISVGYVCVIKETYAYKKCKKQGEKENTRYFKNMFFQSMKFTFNSTFL